MMQFTEIQTLENKRVRITVRYAGSPHYSVLLISI